MEDDSTNDDGDGGTEIANETEGRCGCRDIPRRDKRLERYKRCLKVWTHPNASYDLEGENATPGRTKREVEKETEAKSHEEQSEPDRRKVLPCPLDKYSGQGGDKGEGNYEGKQVNSTENGVGTEDGLKVERKEVSTGNEDHAVGEADG